MSPRPGLLPPIRQKIGETLQALPVIPPIGGKGEVGRDQSGRGEGRAGEVGGGERGEQRGRRGLGEDQIKTRNTHLVKLYCVSFFQVRKTGIFF